LEESNALLKKQISSSAEINFSVQETGFSFNKEKIINGNSLRVDSLDEYPLGYSCNYHDFATREGNYILIKAKIEGDDSLSGLLCIVVAKGDKNLFFTASEIEGYRKNGNKEATAYASMLVGNDMLGMKDEELKVFIWNNKKKKFVVKFFEVTSFNNNPWKYSLLDKIP
jgi:hypothetical protein